MREKERKENLFHNSNSSFLKWMICLVPHHSLRFKKPSQPSFVFAQSKFSPLLLLLLLQLLLLLLLLLLPLLLLLLLLLQWLLLPQTEKERRRKNGEIWRKNKKTCAEEMRREAEKVIWCCDFSSNEKLAHNISVQSLYFFIFLKLTNNFTSEIFTGCS